MAQQQPQTRSQYRIQLYKLSLAALFISLSIILTRYASITPVPTIRVGFGSIPIQIAGIFLGPLSGAVVGLIADPLGFVMNPQGTYHLGFTLTSVLNGVIPGLIALALRRKSDPSVKSGSKWRSVYLALLTTLTVTTFCSALLNTAWLSQLLGTPYDILFIGRLPAIILTAVVHFALLIIIIPALERAGAGRLLKRNRRKQA